MREVRPLVEADIAAAVAIRSFARWGKNDAEHRQRFARNVPKTLGSFQDGRLAAIATMLEIETFVGGAPVTIGGLAGVTTAPDQRRRGHVAGLLRAWYQRLRDRGIGLSGEFPFDPSFYARYGYQTIFNGLRLVLPIERLPSGRHDAVEIPPERLAELEPIHRSYASRHSLSLTRRDESRDYWQVITAPFWLDRPYNVFLMEGAYVVIGIDESQEGSDYPQVDVRDFAYSTPRGRESLLAFLADLAGQVVRAAIHVPPGDPLLAMWGASYAAETDCYQVRVVDVERALAPLRSQDETGFRLVLRDQDCPWNDGAFAVELTRDGSRVTRLAEAAGVTGASEAHVAMDVNTLAALLFGAIDPATALATGSAEGDLAPLIGLSRLLATHPAFVAEADHF